MRRIRKFRPRCVCSLIDQICLMYGQGVEGEIYFKHSPKCKSKTSGSYEWTGAGFKEKGR